MSNSMVFSLFYYFFSIYLFFNVNSLILFWILLEFNLMCFILVSFNLSFLYFSKNSYFCMEFNLYYMIFQMIFSSLFLCLTCMNKEMNLLYDLMLSFIIMCKMGIFPFHHWIFNISSYANSYSFMLMLSFQKVVLFLMMSNFFSSVMLLLMMLNLTVGGFFMLYSNSLKNLILSSSIYNSFWFLIYLMMDYNLFLVYVFNYLLMIFILSINKFLDSKCMFYSNNSISLNFMMLIFFFINVPPMGVFMIKFILILNFLKDLNNFFCFLLMFYFLSLVSYLMYFYVSFFFFKFNYKLVSTNESFHSFITFVLLLNIFLFI